ncbi:serine/threonine-protein kinase pkn2-like [Penaeus japonicus]|uniref:serine/threonine-protein kinase pkn2-like n=1 Tax=Penaeus japonicus TaxID=27405 RepID=UPI001C713B1B|nr:serine/threonine-protein kinase pkn2-like [Penaeus japonicus]
MRRPTQEDVRVLTQYHACFGERLIPLGKGTYGKTFLNEKKEFVLKFARDIENFSSFLLEAKVMMSFVEYASGFQRLVGLYPQKLCLVTMYAGRTLDWFIPSYRLKPEHRYSAMTQVCKVAMALHRNGIAHNDIKPQNVCVEVTASGPQVTFIDFGLARRVGTAPRMLLKWNERLPYAPEICGADKYGLCGPESDTYSVGKLLRQLFSSKLLPQLLSNWYVKSKSRRPSDRSTLTTLVQYLEQQRIADLRTQY